MFGVSAATALGGAAAAVGMRNIFHNILGFAASMLGVAGLFLLLGSDFLAAVLVLVYIGAVAVAMVYAVMLSYPLDEPPRPRSRRKILAAAALALAVFAGLWLAVGGASRPAAAVGEGVSPSIARVGRLLLTDYVLAFELISVLLVVAVIGAVMVARRGRTAP